MVGLIAGLFIGAVVMDALWAHKLGIDRVVWAKVKRKFSRRG